jgi:DNA end-binding protein Ku
MPGERRVDLRFHMLDSRDNARIRYERVNADTGEEVPWKNVVKAYEYKKGNYVVMEEEVFREAKPETNDAINIEGFIESSALGPEYYERPYYLVPQKKAEKGYVLLRNTLQSQKRIGLARVVIRMREHLALVLPRDKALMLIIVRYPQELIAADDYALPEGAPKAYRISSNEEEMAQRLVESMTIPWRPGDYRDDFREKLGKAIEKRISGKRGRVSARDTAPAPAESDKVVDFMALLRKSIESKQRTPPRRRAAPRRSGTGGGKRKRG